MLGATAIELFGEPRVAALAEAACVGDVAAVNAAVADGVDPNSISVGFDELGGRVTPLLWAVDCENSRGVEALLRAGADPNQSTGGRVGLTPILAAAADARNPVILRFLLQNGGNPNAISEVGGYTALRRAYEHGRSWESAGGGRAAWENWETLLDAGANAEATFDGGRDTIATFAAKINDFDTVIELLRRGYSHDLTYLGFWLQLDAEIPEARAPRFPIPPLAPEVEAARQQAIAMLVQRGVRFPMSREDVGFRDPNAPLEAN
ncbi:ankyrin repeat domain-containing protein [Terricaulis sp.]|uniref:ankyrin repeat domain-containing protein n=1 Tax=Terricaulis sp. TaxID=2768686 RepID=UPI002AC48857|nr:ankyrin repeat domain-containing protein [Terricaulis sp.]MDZ4691127.1 ankyrin repeat domain-containing protein [Terricaulis sp.]